jgi:hypothetical protein
MRAQHTSLSGIVAVCEARRMRWIVVVLAGCGSAPARPTIANSPPRDAGGIDAAGCEVDSTTIRPGTVEIVTCQTGDTANSPRDREEGNFERRMRGDLVLRTPTGSAVKPLGTWKNGIEWETTWKILGTLTDGHGSDVILVRSLVTVPNESQLGMFTDTLHAYAFVRGAWAEVYTLTAGSVEVTIAPDNVTAKITSCNLSKAKPAPGCDTYDDGEVGPHATLRWDGTRVVVLP